MRRNRIAAALATTALAASGLAVLSAPAEATTYYTFGCNYYGTEVSSGGYTHVQEYNNTNCDYVGALTYTYLGGGQREATTTYGLAYANAYKTSGGSYSGGAANARYNGAWAGWSDIIY